MKEQQVSSEWAEKARPGELFETLGSSNQGLSYEEASKRLEQYGPNAQVSGLFLGTHSVDDRGGQVARPWQPAGSCCYVKYNH